QANASQQVQINPRPQAFSIPFAGLVTDKSHSNWDLLLAGTWEIADARRFLTGHALAMLTPGASMTKQFVESWIGNTLSDRVRDAVRGQAIEDLRDADALPARWWEKRFAEWLSDSGISMKIASAKWDSADAARAEETRRREQDLHRLAEQREKERQAEL